MDTPCPYTTLCRSAPAEPPLSARRDPRPLAPAGEPRALRRAPVTGPRPRGARGRELAGLPGGRRHPGRGLAPGSTDDALRSEEHTSELQSLMRTSYAVVC